MQRVQAAKQRLTRLVRDAAKRATDTAARSALQLVEAAHERTEAWRNGEQGRRVADAVLTTGERLIDKSPVPVPVVVRDALGRMQDALGQLGGAIEVESASAAPEKAAEAVRAAAKLASRQHFSGQVAGLSPAELAHVGEQARQHRANARKHT